MSNFAVGVCSAFLMANLVYFMHLVSWLFQYSEKKSVIYHVINITGVAIGGFLAGVIHITFTRDAGVFVNDLSAVGVLVYLLLIYGSWIRG